MTSVTDATLNIRFSFADHESRGREKQPVPISRKELAGLFCRVNGTIRAGGNADAVPVSFRRVYDCFSVHQSYGLLRAGFDAFKRACAF